MQPKEKAFSLKTWGLLAILVVLVAMLGWLFIEYTATSKANVLNAAAQATNSVSSPTNGGSNSGVDIKMGNREIKGDGPFTVCIIADGMIILGLAALLTKMKL